MPFVRLSFLRPWVYRNFPTPYNHSLPYIVRSFHIDNMPKDKESKTLQVKVPKGTRDWFGSDVALRDKIFGTITDVFKRHGAVTLDTPAFELKEILTGKYGEDSKLIYDLADQGGEICSLRYDLTLPTARFLAMNPTIQHLKRYQIAKVWRRDNPAIQKGRMREFTQCDFDIAGIFDPMLPDAEVLKITTEVFRELDFEGRYTIKVNHRKVLDGMFQVCGVPQEKIRAISSAVDKLDKSPWEEVRREMTEEKGLDPAVADKIGGYVKSDMDIPIGANCRERSLKVLESLERDEALLSNELAKQGIKDLRLLFDYLDIWNCTQYVSYDMSLARGLDYYTGPIWEVVTEGSKPKTMEKEERKPSKKKAANAEDVEDRSNDPTVGIGSIAAGGRYDELVGVFSKKGRIPCVGISFGVDRIFSIIKNRGAPPRAAEVDVYVMSFGGSGSLKERMQVAAMLWNAGITAEFAWKAKPKLPQQFKAAESSGVPYAVILGEDELKAGKVKIKELGLEEGHPEKEGVLLPMDELVEGIKSRLTAKRDAEKKKATDERNKRDEELQGKLADLQMKP